MEPACLDDDQAEQNRILAGWSFAAAALEDSSLNEARPDTKWEPDVPYWQKIDRRLFFAIDCEMIGTVTREEWANDQVEKLKWEEQKALLKLTKPPVGTEPIPKNSNQVRDKPTGDGKKDDQDKQKQKQNLPRRVRAKQRNTLARVSIVGWDLRVLLDLHVQPPLDHIVEDYRTWISGIEPWHVTAANGAVTFAEAQKQVKDLLRRRYVVGHSLTHDLTSLDIQHWIITRSLGVLDTAKADVYQVDGDKNGQGLRKLCRQYLGREMKGLEKPKGKGRWSVLASRGKDQDSAHSSIEDAIVTMELFKLKFDKIMEWRERQLGIERKELQKQKQAARALILRKAREEEERDGV